MEKLGSKKFWAALVALLVMLARLFGVKLNAPYVNEIIDSVCAVCILIGIGGKSQSNGDTDVSGKTDESGDAADESDSDESGDAADESDTGENDTGVSGDTTDVSDDTGG